MRWAACVLALPREARAPTALVGQRRGRAQGPLCVLGTRGMRACSTCLGGAWGHGALPTARAHQPSDSPLRVQKWEQRPGLQRAPSRPAGGGGGVCSPFGALLGAREGAMQGSAEPTACNHVQGERGGRGGAPMTAMTAAVFHRKVTLYDSI